MIDIFQSGIESQCGRLQLFKGSEMIEVRTPLYCKLTLESSWSIGSVNCIRSCCKRNSINEGSSMLVDIVTYSDARKPADSAGFLKLLDDVFAARLVRPINRSRISIREILSRLKRKDFTAIYATIKRARQGNNTCLLYCHE